MVYTATPSQLEAGSLSGPVAERLLADDLLLAKQEALPPALPYLLKAGGHCRAVSYSGEVGRKGGLELQQPRSERGDVVGRGG